MIGSTITGTTEVDGFVRGIDGLFSFRGVVGYDVSARGVAVCGAGL